MEGYQIINMEKRSRKKGILFWITGLSGSGKTTLGKTIHKDITKLYGPTIMISGDNLRKIFKLNGHKKEERLKLSNSYCQFAKYLTNQKINIIFAVVSMFDKPRKWNRQNIKNYVEIYVKSDLKKIIRLRKKKIYHKKNIKNLVGIDIVPEFPKKPNIIIKNFFSKSKEKISKELVQKIKKIIN
tara:strand:+ start:107 stop:658 length:552 start_codon:yes stop_codon:yes gene_type:complete